MDPSGAGVKRLDVTMMLRITGEAVDTGALREWAQRLDLQQTLEQARRFSPD